MRTYEGLRFCWTCNQFQTCQDCRTFAYGCISCSEHKFEHNLAQCIRNFGDYIAMPSPSTTGMIQAENEAISAAIDAIINKG